MRKCIEEQLRIGEVDIEDIQLDMRSRDEIPKILYGLIEIYKNEEMREKIFAILKEVIPSHISQITGRPGISFWQIFVLGNIRLTCNIDYDKLQELANQHQSIRQMLGHSIFDDKQYPLQTLKDNLMLFTPDILDRINKVVVEFGRQVAGADKDEDIHAKCDSFPVPTNVHFPTDISLLFDALRKIITLIMKLNSCFNISGWRQGEYLLRKLKRLYRLAQKIKHSTSKDEKKRKKRRKLIKEIYSTYLELAAVLVERAKVTLNNSNSADPLALSSVIIIEHFIKHAERQIDQITRRVLEDEKIPHSEKVFSIFEEHTEWLSKGKAGVPQVLGLNVCVITDQYGFILEHLVMQKETDSGIAVKIIRNAIAKFPNITSCSFDKGFHSPQNQIDLGKILNKVYLPQKGRLSEARKEVEYSDDFIDACKKHSSIEASIACLINHGLDICPDHGIFGFKRYVGLAMVSRNIHHIGHIIQQRKLRKLQKEEKKKRKASLKLQKAA